MNTLRRGLKEWNATIEALGQGKQSILLRKYSTTIDKFFLYPTYSYAMVDNYLEKFKPEYQSFVEKNKLPKIENNKIEIKYYAEVEKIIKKPARTIGKYDDFVIWTKDHVKSYFSHSDAYIWFLKIYKLDNSFMADLNRGIKYAVLNNEYSINNSSNVIEFNELNSTFKEIENL